MKKPVEIPSHSTAISFLRTCASLLFLIATSPVMFAPAAVVPPSPTIACPTNLFATATGPGGAVVFYTITASGGCTPPPFVSANPPSGSTFPIGTTTVLATASDTCGHSTNCSFTVTVNPPSTPISITCPSNMVTTATGPGGAVGFYTVSASGGCSPPPFLSASPPSGSTFPIGMTTVLASASDTCGHSTNCSFTVTVNPPSTPISITCPSNIVMTATAPGGAVVFYTVSASGGCTPPPFVSASPPSGSTFPIGMTTVLATASDTCGHSTNCSFTVTVNPPSTPISIACPSNMVTTATGPGGAVVFYTVSASGGCTPPPFVSANPPSGSTFPIGTTTVFASASDTCGHSTNCSFTVTVNPPSTPISITCPSNIVMTATGPGGAVVFYAVSASGGCTPPPFVSASPPSGSTFPIGMTTVHATASDTCGNSTNCSFTVTVNPPSTPISITCPSNMVTTATGPGGAVVFYTVTASGGCSPPPFVSASPPSGSTFPIGMTTVHATASDTCGNSTNCSFTVTVNPPSTPISITCSSNIVMTATGPGGAVVFYTVTASGGCSPPPFVSASPPSGSTFPIGMTTVHATASDTCGHSTNCSFSVTVNSLVSHLAILGQPQSQIVSDGTSVMLNVQATGDPPLSYQWQFAGTNLPGANGSSLFLSPITAALEGVYTVLVSNLVEYVTSDPAFVYVQRPRMTVRASAGQGGSISPAGVLTMNTGSDAVFAALPAPGFEVDRWYLDGSAVQDGGNNFTLDDLENDVTISNSFRLVNPQSIPFHLDVTLAMNPPQVLLDITGDPAEAAAIEQSSNLRDWVPKAMLTNFSGHAQFADPIPPGTNNASSASFYRIRTGTPWPAMSFVGGSPSDSTASAALVLPADLSIPTFGWQSFDSLVGEAGASSIPATFWQVIRDANGVVQVVQFAGAVRDAYVTGTVVLSNAVQATVQVIKTVQGVQRQIGYALSLLSCKILADSSRDGVVDSNDDTNKLVFTTGPNGWGATVLVNCDDDNGDHIPDNWPGGSINGVDTPADSVVNGAADVFDLGQVVVSRTGIPAGMLPDRLQIRLQVTLPKTPEGNPVNEPHYFDQIPPERRVRLFLPTQAAGQDLQVQDADQEILGPTRGAMAVFLKPPAAGPLPAGQYDYSRFTGTGRLIFGIEGIEFAAAVDVRLQFYFGALPLCSDRVRIKTAPFLLLANNNTVTRTVVSSARDPGPPVVDNSAFTAAFDAADNVATTVIPAATSQSDVWAQDEWEIGFTQVPSVGGGVRTRTVVLDLPRNRGLRSYAIQNFLASSVGVFHPLKGNFRGNELTYGGNIECSGPVTVTNNGTVRDYRLGRVILGQSFTRRSNGTAFDPALLDFFMAQGVQDPILIDTGWLGVGHVDEVIGLVPNASTPDPRDFRMLIGSAARGRTVLNNIAAGNNGVRIMNGRGSPWEMTVGQFKADLRGIQTVNTMIQNRHIAPIRRQLERELNLTMTEVPALYYTPVNTDPSADRDNVGTVSLRNIRVTPANTPFDVTLWTITFRAAGAGGMEFVVAYRRAYLGDPPTAIAPAGTTAADFNTGQGVVLPAASWANAATAAAGDLLYFYTSKGAMETAAWFPAVQNAQVANDRVLAPAPQGPVIAGQDALQADYEAALAGLGLTFSYPAPNDEFRWYHTASGEVHCGSNRFSDPYPQAGNRWWMQPPSLPSP